MRPNYDLNDTSTGIHSAMIRSTRQTAREQRSHPVMLRRRPLFLLWLMLRRREPNRGDRPRESSMPPGCALVVRYHSR
jgi:hypothetical protein